MSFGTRIIEAEVATVVNVDELPDRRANQRRRVLKSANIFFNKGYGAYDCVVKNLTDAGALIKMEDSSGLPGIFDFVVKGEDEKRPAKIAWRSNGMCGVKFL
ncbi:MAG: PilZ domain-containing protein [Salaquimonas sp.]